MREQTEKGEDSILTRKEIGKRGEVIAAGFLERKGLRIVERNYHCRWGELDLVAAESDNRIHFVEVKTRTVTLYGAPAEAVTYMKQQKIKKTALTWLQSQEQYFSDLSFDVIEVSVIENTARIRWLQHCF